MRRLLETLPAGAYTCDQDGLITYFNQRAAEIWGREPRLNHPGDRFCGSFKLYSAEGAPLRHERSWMALALHNGRCYNGQEIVIERPDGELRTVLAHANPVYDERGELIGALNVLVDISDRKRAQEALREADRSKEALLATLSHELRNPLAPIRNATAILRLQDLPSVEARWALEVIDRQSLQMSHLIDALLDATRLARNRLELRLERLELAAIVATALETSRPLFDAGGPALAVALPAEAIWLDADATRLAQALSNLLSNAAKFTGPGGRVELSAERQGSEAVVTVRDTGIGIPPEMLESIFEMFTQVDQSLERSHNGLGLGLTLARRLVEMHGGTIEAASEGPGKGSEFTVRLPVAAADEPATSLVEEGVRGAAS